MLNDDDALELFKKTLPAGASFMQIQVSSKAMRSRALEVMQAASRTAKPFGRRHLDFVLLALHGKQAGFDKILQMIDGMIETLKTEQKDDEHKKEYCLKEFDVSADK